MANTTGFITIGEQTPVTTRLSFTRIHPGDGTQQDGFLFGSLVYLWKDIKSMNLVMADGEAVEFLFDGHKHTKTLTLNVWNDSDTECPIGFSGDDHEKIVDFRDSSIETDTYQDYDEDWHQWLLKEIQDGTAYFLRMREHSDVTWSLLDGVPEKSEISGIYFLPSDVPENERALYAKAAISEYTEWCNGSCYGYSISNEKGITTDSCGGFIGSDYFVETLKTETEAMIETAKETGVDLLWIVKGEAKWLLEHHDLKLVMAE